MKSDPATRAVRVSGLAPRPADARGRGSRSELRASTRRGQGRSALSETMTDATPMRSSALSAGERATGIEGSWPGTEVDDLLFTRTIGRSEATNAGSALAESESRSALRSVGAKKIRLRAIIRAAILHCGASEIGAGRGSNNVVQGGFSL
jgi:hypothetical protein